MYYQAGRGILRVCRDVTSKEVFVDITAVSFYLEELFVQFVCCVPCKLFLVLTPPCGPLVLRWCIKMSRVSAFNLGCVQRWGNLSLNFALSKLWCENLMLTFSEESVRLSARMPFIEVVDCSTCSRFPLAVMWVLLEISTCKSFPEVILQLWFAMFTVATDAFPLSEYCVLPLSFRWVQADHFRLVRVNKWDNPFRFRINLSWK